ncbi:oligoendopeptidase F [Virgibacillus pantothenticus]|uniref:Oligopeptidase F n=1 Tax=Virgibacillus pantothenticus TaxID=1473 RepID=A0A0L0QTW6_VIRPA|nr:MULTISPECIES: oligoendopeptidase F [Virgibacillus]API91012.1 oligoendopeptidase F [Virgibacillus sp. 6R]KNE22029.1 oligopeptidase PepB [Virgibacillus pantothenticus]MBS7428997.1 oligoendopeptidase F [Virgibacillus sp. 19R1-5]MBU8566750.1 oligoendopeptidase F [Virgibacillus pantothenticus]MBU8600333.1 oligoendopeptidase F [Virgibacillus pantothenticus]
MAKASKELPKREEIPVELTWRLEDIFETDEAWEKELADLQKAIPEIETFQGKLGASAKNLYDVLKLQDQLSERLGKLFTYSHMRYDQDTANSFYQRLNAQAENVLTVASSKMSYIVPEILEIDESTLKQFLQEEKGLQNYKKTLDEITRQRPHILNKREEAILAEASEPLGATSQTFGMLNNADLTFPSIKDENGEEVDVTHGRYIRFMESQDRSVRKAAFQAMYETYGKFKNTFASTLSGNIKKDNFIAKVRNYDSARQAALDDNNIPEKVYDNLVEAVNERLPLLHRYIKLRKKVLGLDELHMYDIYTPLVQDANMQITYEKAQQYVLEGLAPLGEDYLEIVKQAYDNRWIDVEENRGKRSGAYSSGAYGTNPYILLNWQDNVNDMFTLAHELGHSVHSYYTRNNQPYRYGNYSIFVAEVASTCNEALLNDYLLNNLNDEKQKLYLLNHFLEGFRGTVFRQTMFAEFEHLIHVKQQQGEALTAEKLTEIYYDLNKKYYGDDVVSDEEIGLEWARIPHFYYNYYVYQYATGYSAATALAQQILTENEGAVERYIDFLKAGSSDYPIEVLKKAGVDMNSKQTVLDALDVFAEKLEQLEELLN